MQYKTILVHVDHHRSSMERVRLAARLALAHGAHLVGTALTSSMRYLAPGQLDPAGSALAEQYACMMDDANRALDRFCDVAASEGVPSFERRLLDDDLDGGLAVQARYADLLVVGQDDPADTTRGLLAGLAEYALLSSGRPVLVQPYAGRFDTLDGHVLLAWDASVEATRAVTLALPLLRAARLVSVVLFNPGKAYGAHGEQPGADIALFLSRHGVNVEVAQHASAIDTGNALLSLAADTNADLLVMGGYGHTRFRELLLGGVTDTILRSMTLPVLLAH